MWRTLRRRTRFNLVPAAIAVMALGGAMPERAVGIVETCTDLSPAESANQPRTTTNGHAIEIALDVVRDALRESLAARAFVSEYEMRLRFGPERRPGPTVRYAMATAEGMLRIDGLDSGTSWLLAPTHMLTMEPGARRALWQRHVVDPHEDVAMLFNGLDRIASFAGFRSLHEELALATVDAVIADGHLLTLRYRIESLDAAQRASFEATGSSPPAGAMRHEIVVDTATRRLVGTTRYLPTADDPNCAKAIAGVGGRAVSVMVETWEPFEGMEIPHRVRRVVRGPGGQSEQLFVRTFMAPFPEVDRPAVMTVLTDGWRVIDRDLSLEFTVGSRQLRWHGIAWRLDQPLHEHPGDRLSELLSNATVDGELGLFGP